MNLKSVKVVVFGSSEGKPEQYSLILKELISALAESGMLNLIYGMSWGYPQYVVSQVKKSNSEITILGLSPYKNLKQHKDSGDPLDADKIEFLDNRLTDFNERYVANSNRLVRFADGVICVGGGLFTKGEMLNAIDAGIPVAILDSIPGAGKDYTDKNKDNLPKNVIVNEDPKKLIKLLTNRLIK